MAVSQKQLEANRRNARKSTGPKTEFGKKTVSKNAISHGIFAKNTVINSKHYSENQTEYNELVQTLTAELKPKSFLQKYLVNKIANILWRSKRLIAAETAQVNRQMDNFDFNYAHDKLKNRYNENNRDDNDDYVNKLSNLIGINLLPYGESSKRLHLYETRLDNQLNRTYRLLKQLQIENHFESLQNHNKKSKTEKANPFPMRKEQPIEQSQTLLTN